MIAAFVYLLKTLSENFHIFSSPLRSLVEEVQYSRAIMIMKLYITEYLLFIEVYRDNT